MKYVLITGTSSGIGEATAKLFINDGIFVIGVDLNPQTITAENYYHIQADLTKDEALDNIYNEVNKLTKHLDALFNIAGIFMLESIVEGSIDDLYRIIEINFFSVYKLNKKLLPLLDDKSKILITSSEVARYSPQPFNGYYTLSKVILDKYADILRRELNYIHIKVIKIQSGAIKTNLLNGVNSKYEGILSSTKLYKRPLTKLKKLMDGEITKQTSPEVVAKTIHKIFYKKHTKLLYKIKNSFKLRFLNILPEKLQDIIYVNVIK